MRGLSVLTRPSRISGKPVYSSTGRVSIPCSASSRAVPPVDTISTPRFTSPRANSSNPRLSETLRSARWIRTSPGATVGAAGGCVSPIRLDAHEPRIGRIERHAPGGDQPHGARQKPVLDVVEALKDRRDVAMVRKLERLLQDD